MSLLKMLILLGEKDPETILSLNKRFNDERQKEQQGTFSIGSIIR